MQHERDEKRGMKRAVQCTNCGATKLKEVGEINRAIKQGRNIYCSQACAGEYAARPRPDCLTCGEVVRGRPDAIYCSRECYIASFGTTEERFWKSVNKAGPNDCWTWKFGKDWNGYGQFSADGRVQRRAHRFSWELANNRPVPAGMFICHSCDNPSCVNPAHLWAGTARQNTADMLSKGRGKYQRSEEKAA